MDVMVGIIGGDKDAAEVLFHGMKEFPAKKVVLIALKAESSTVSSIQKDLAKFKIPVDVLDIINPSSLEQVFAAIQKVKEREEGNRVIISVDTDYTSSCLALSAAFVNGVQAIGVLNDEIIAYPIMKFSYYSALSEKKIEVMRELHKQQEYVDFDGLAKKIRMSLPLLSYHINGNLKSTGLLQLGLVEVRDQGQHKQVMLNQLGKLLVKGYVDYEKTKKG
ncbi:MAG: hypothetical protein AABX51_05020 [Nanoarchaeota archaeon]